MIYFFHYSCSFPDTKKLPKVSDHFVEKIQHESTTLSNVSYICANLMQNEPKYRKRQAEISADS